MASASAAGPPVDIDDLAGRGVQFLLPAVVDVADDEQRLVVETEVSLGA